MIDYSLNWLLLTCKPGKKCDIGTYTVSTRLRWLSLKKSLDPDTIVLVAVSTKLKTGVQLLTFEVRKIEVEPPTRLLPVDLTPCVPGVCVDGVVAKIGDYKSYIYEKYALTYRETLDGYYYGNLFLRGAIGSTSWWTRWRMRKHLSRALSRT